MSEYSYVEQPILGWLCGEPKAKYGARSLGWTYRDEAAMAAYERPLARAAASAVAESTRFLMRCGSPCGCGSAEVDQGGFGTKRRADSDPAAIASRP